MLSRVQGLWRDQDGQDIAEYAVMLAVILVIVVGTVRLIGTQSNNVFSSVASSIQYTKQLAGRAPLSAVLCSAICVPCRCERVVCPVALTKLDITHSA